MRLEVFCLDFYPPRPNKYLFFLQRVICNLLFMVLKRILFTPILLVLSFIITCEIKKNKLFYEF